ncbi:MAG: bifunctional phosphoglucose/phosphomannose isomerase [bacterium]
MRKRFKEKIEMVDRSGMYGKILEFPEQLLKGWEIGKPYVDALDVTQFRNIVWDGMGGSAIAGDLINSLLAETLPIPIFVNRGYRLPGFVDSKTLFIASSYSGNTEETLSAANEAVERGCSILCVTTGGRLGQIAEENAIPTFRLPSGYPPRAALGYNLGLFLSIFRQMGLSMISRDDLAEAVSFLTEQSNYWMQNDGKGSLPYRLAREIRGRIPLIHTSDRLSPVGYRWKTQFNENSKTHAFTLPFPEMNHNEIVGWEVLSDTETFFQHLAMVLLSVPDDFKRIRTRMDITKDLIEESGGLVLEVEGEGPSFLARLLHLIFMGDLVSFYLAVLYNADPTEILKIDHLKKALSKFA